MEPGHETESPATADETPLPIRVDGLTVPPAAPAPGPPAATAASVLLLIAAADGPWFPAAFAAANGVPRDSLDEPLAELRVAGLVLAAQWVRGTGQGYALTRTGRGTVADAEVLERLKAGAPAAEVATLAAAGLGDPPAPDPAAIEAGERDARGREPALASRAPVVVPALLMANAIWFFICAVWGIRWGLTLDRSLIEGHPEVLHRFGAIRGLDLLAGEWWRLFSCCFVHIGALHLLGNLFALAMMGPLAEMLWGRWRLVLIYAVSGLAGSALAMAIRPDSLLAGASGAIWGIQMSLFAWLFTFRRQLPTDVAADWFRRLTVVFLLNAAVSFLPNVSWEGHLGGGLGGLLTAGLLNAARFGARPRRLAAGLLLTILPAFCVAGLAGAMGAKGMPGWQRVHKRLAADRADREAQEKLHRVRAAVREYGEVAARLPALAPAPAGLHVTKVGAAYANLSADEWEAVVLLKGPDRNPAQVGAARAKIQARKHTAEEVVERTAREPFGDDSFDQHRERVHRFAVARAKSFELLLRILDSNGPPAWDAWDAARRDAERLWDEVKAK